jgi:ribosomal protein S18 acetylase RimI-like enzyme
MPVTIRPAKPADLSSLARMAAALVRQHHGFDAARFMLPEDLESGYRWWLAREMKRPDAMVLVAELDGAPVGYAYGTVEGRDWSALRDTCGALHDIWVEESARGQGAGSALLEELVRRFKELGMPRIVLMSATQNATAQRLFAKHGWRPTMVEMTREL